MSVAGYQTFTAEHLYNLLPAVMRRRDVEEGEPLKALLSVLAEQGQVVEKDIERLYNNTFIETCESWSVPYIGDLLRCSHLHGLEDIGFSQRAYVANTIGYRRRKGTLSVMESLAHDTTGWISHGREFFSTLSTTQNINHVRHFAPAMADVGDANSMELVDGAFDTQPRTVDIRHIDSAYGEAARYNISNIGLYLWRLQSYSISMVTARRKKDSVNNGYYFIDPLRNDLHIFNKPKTEYSISQISQEVNVPSPLRRIPLYLELEQRRQDIIEGRSFAPLWFDDAPPFKIYVQNVEDGEVMEVPFEEILVCNLEKFKKPKKNKRYIHSQTGAIVKHPLQVAIDPELGRLAFPSGVKPFRVKVDYAYGFSGDYGAGPYKRYNDISDLTERDVDWHVAVTQEEDSVANSIFASISDAVKDWHNQPAGTVGVISILDNHIYTENLVGTKKIEVPEGSLLIITGADWTKSPTDVDGEMKRVTGEVEASGLAPIILGNIEVLGNADSGSDTPGDLILDGVRISGNINVLGSGNANLGALDIRSCTIGYSKGMLKVNSKNKSLTINCSRSIISEINIVSGIQNLSITDTIINKKVEALQVSASISSCTILGEVDVQEIFAQNTIFVGKLITERQQSGCLRFCYTVSGSITPRKFRCLPDVVLKDTKTGDSLPVQDQDRIIASLTPSFTSDVQGHHAYGQLGDTCNDLFKTSAEDGNEMGVFHGLKNSYRQKNMSLAGREYLRFGLQYGVLFEN